MRRLFYFIIQFSIISVSYAQVYNPIPVIFPELENIYNAQMYGFGHVSAVSGSSYVQSSISGNPALIANQYFNKGFLITGPILSNKFQLFDANIIFSNHPKNYFVFHSDYIRYHEVFENTQSKITLNTMLISRTTTQSLTYGHIINPNFSWGFCIKYFRPEKYSGIIGNEPVLIMENNIFNLDVGISYKKPIELLEKKIIYENGLFTSNLGARVDTKIHEDYPKAFLPTKLHFGNLLKYRTEVKKKVI